MEIDPAGSSHPDTAARERCSRCDVEMVLQPLYEGSADDCWFCPCCKSKLQTVPMLEAKWERKRVALGMTVEEFEDHMAAQTKATIKTEPLSEDELRGLHRLLDRQAKEWKPVCEHDTNPYLPKESSRG